MQGSSYERNAFRRQGRPGQTGRSGGEQRDRLGKAFEYVIVPIAADHGRRAIVHGGGDQNLTRLRGGLHTCGAIDDSADRREIAVRVAELAEIRLAAVDADPDAEFDIADAEVLDQRIVPG